MNYKNILIVVFVLFSLMVQAKPTWPKIKSHVASDKKIEARVQEILSQMSLEQKVGQMVQAEIKHITPAEAKKYHVGSILNGGGSFPNNNKYAQIADWVNLADQFYTASTQSKAGIPIIWGTDAVHGHNNVLGATIFPHNIGLGASRNPLLIKKIGEKTTLEVLATGIDWIFAPTVAVVRNDRWGRTYEGYSEDPQIVKSYAGPMVFGMQGKDKTLFNQNHVVATVKHFVGDGGTIYGKDQGNNISSEQELIKLHAQGYFSGLQAGAQTVMASFNSWKGSKIHGSKYLLTTVLKQKMGFDGFVVGDWNGHGQVKNCTNQSCAQAINAGVDMLMAPQDWKELIANTIKQVKLGKISRARIDDAVTRILRVKLRAGLFERGLPSQRMHAGNTELIGHPDHRRLARQAVQESLVLLKNKKNILPLNPQKKILVTGAGAHNIGMQSGGWTLTWQGTGNKNSDFPGGTSIYDGIKQKVDAAGGQVELSPNGSLKTKPDVAIVVFGETPYAEGQGDIENLLFNGKYPQNLVLLNQLKKLKIPIVSVFLTGRPLWVNPELNRSDAFLVAWLPGSEGVGVSDVLFKSKRSMDFKGKLSYSWPNVASPGELNRGDKQYSPLFKYGYGLTYQDQDTLGDNLSENPFPQGDHPKPKDKVEVFKGRTFPPYINYVGDFASWKHPLNNSMGKSLGGLVTVKAVDKDVQEDARQVIFHGGDSNFYFQSKTKINLMEFVKSGVLKFDYRLDQRPNRQVNILMGLAKVNFNQFLSASLGQWKELQISLKCFQKKGSNFSTLDMPFSLATFGAFQISLANIEILKTGKASKGCK